MRVLVISFVLVGGLIGLAACRTTAIAPPEPQPAQGASQAATPTIPPPPTLEDGEIATGKMIYDLYCAACHGTDLEGQADWKTQNEDGSFKAPPHSADGHTWHHPDQELLVAIQMGGSRFEGMNIGGTSNMPAYADILTAEEMSAVLSYLKSTWPDDIRQIQWEVSVLSDRQS